MGEDEVLDADATSHLPVTFTSQTPSICSVDHGTSTGLLPGTCKIALDQPGNDRYSAAPQEIVSQVVQPIAQTITFPPLDDVVFGGDIETSSPPSTPTCR